MIGLLREERVVRTAELDVAASRVAQEVHALGLLPFTVAETQGRCLRGVYSGSAYVMVRSSGF